VIESVYDEAQGEYRAQYEIKAVINIGRTVELGSIVVVCHPDESRCHLTEFEIYPEFRNQGIGSIILAYAIELCRKMKAKRITLSATRKAVPLYKRFGFFETGCPGMELRL